MSPKFKRVMSWILSAIVTLVFLFAGLAKLAGVEQQVEAFAAWGYPDWSIYAVGVIEVILALLIIFPRTRVTGTNLVYIWAVVAIFTHIQAEPPQYIQIIPDIVIIALAFFIRRLS